MSAEEVIPVEGGFTAYPNGPPGTQLASSHLKNVGIYGAMYGTVFIFAGVAAIVLPIRAVATCSLILGSLFCIGGAFSLFTFWTVSGAFRASPFILLGIFHVTTGVWVIAVPFLGVWAFAFIITPWLLFHGLFKIMLAGSVAGIYGWHSPKVTGWFSVLLGVAFYFLQPLRCGVPLPLCYPEALWLGITVGVDLLVLGGNGFHVALLASSGATSRGEVREADNLLSSLDESSEDLLAAPLLPNGAAREDGTITNGQEE
eukprot:TRINITY_DN38743_c0_g1_i1.p1 TRINITY_DN38743_c0_g1~~TRINITY_DN38743_c0_g1_i1.p1  ORF type:complete len:258 (-),score=22.54 TRINITY_DN38743_c0_g1_i1:750-1523(-)